MKKELEINGVVSLYSQRCECANLLYGVTRGISCSPKIDAVDSYYELFTLTESDIKIWAADVLVIKSGWVAVVPPYGIVFTGFRSYKEAVAGVAEWLAWDDQSSQFGFINWQLKVAHFSGHSPFAED